MTMPQLNSPALFRLMPEGIDVAMPEDAVDIPDAADEILTQYQAEEEGNSPAVCGYATVSKQKALDKPAYEDGKPHPAHSPATC